MKKSDFIKQKITNKRGEMQNLLDSDDASVEAIENMQKEIDALNTKLKAQLDIENAEASAAESNVAPLDTTNLGEKKKIDPLLQDATNFRNDLLNPVNTLETGTDSKGGVVVGETLAKAIIRELKDRSGAYDFFEGRIGKGKLSIVAIKGETPAEWVPEGTSPSGTNDPNTTIITLDQHRLYKEIELTQQLINSSPKEFVEEIKRVVADAIIDGIEAGIFTGSGSDQPTGIITGLTSTRKVTMATRGTVILSELKKLKHKVNKKYWKNAKIFMHSDTFEAIDLLEDKNGRPLLKEDIKDGTMYRLLGLLVEVSDSIPSIHDTGLKCIAIIAHKSAYKTNTQKTIKFDIYNDSAYKKKGVVGLASDVYMDGNIQAMERVAGLMNPAS